MSAGALTPKEGGFLIRVRVTPNAARDALEGEGSDAAGRTYLKARVRAVPEKGAANAAVAKLLAKAFGVAKSAVSLERGAGDRVKTFRVEGGAEALAAAERALHGERT